MPETQSARYRRDPGPAHPAHRGLARIAEVRAQLDILGQQDEWPDRAICGPLFKAAARLGILPAEVTERTGIGVDVVRVWTTDSDITAALHVIRDRKAWVLRALTMGTELGWPKSRIVRESGITAKTVTAWERGQ